ncbi:hypothetical protein BC829DRAFT_443342 [Chytridium lagenaria]|nr:hypothetical protein BC829DRAFT_443342 [Chytridium lagenaria]
MMPLSLMVMLMVMVMLHGVASQGVPTSPYRTYTTFEGYAYIADGNKDPLVWMRRPNSTSWTRIAGISVGVVVVGSGLAGIGAEGSLYVINSIPPTRLDTGAIWANQFGGPTGVFTKHSGSSTGEIWLMSFTNVLHNWLRRPRGFGTDTTFSIVDVAVRERVFVVTQASRQICSRSFETRDWVCGENPKGVTFRYVAASDEIVYGMDTIGRLWASQLPLTEDSTFFYTGFTSDAKWLNVPNDSNLPLVLNNDGSVDETFCDRNVSCFSPPPPPSPSPSSGVNPNVASIAGPSNSTTAAASSSSQSMPVGIIVGSTVGVCALIAGAVALVLLMRRHRRDTLPSDAKTHFYQPPNHMSNDTYYPPSSSSSSSPYTPPPVAVASSSNMITPSLTGLHGSSSSSSNSHLKSMQALSDSVKTKSSQFDDAQTGLLFSNPTVSRMENAVVVPPRTGSVSTQAVDFEEEAPPVYRERTLKEKMGGKEVMEWSEKRKM